MECKVETYIRLIAMQILIKYLSGLVYVAEAVVTSDSVTKAKMFSIFQEYSLRVLHISLLGIT